MKYFASSKLQKQKSNLTLTLNPLTLKNKQNPLGLERLDLDTPKKTQKVKSMKTIVTDEKTIKKKGENSCCLSENMKTEKNITR